MKEIILTQGFKTVVDDADFEYLSQFNWFICRSGKSKECVYARRWRRGSRCTEIIFMHREISGARCGEEVDHIDGDRLNNQKINLRACSVRENLRAFQRKKAGATSVYRGVCRHGGGKWQSAIRAGQIQENGMAGVVYLGLFDNEEDAARAYDERAKVAFGEFAQLNFPA